MYVIIIFTHCSDENKLVKKAVTSIGRQPDSNIYIFSASIQVSGDDGKLFPLTEQPYIWVDEILQYTSVMPNSQLLASLPSCREPLKVLVEGLRMLTQKNFMSSVFVLGK